MIKQDQKTGFNFLLNYSGYILKKPTEAKKVVDKSGSVETLILNPIPCHLPQLRPHKRCTERFKQSRKFFNVMIFFGFP